MVNTKKSQTAAEFMVVLAVVLVVFLSFLGIFDSRRDEFIAKPQELAARQVAEDIASAINDVYLIGNNATTSIIVPSRLDKTDDFNITLIPNASLVQVCYGSRLYTYPILTSAIPEMVAYPGELNFTNSGGVIIASQ